MHTDEEFMKLMEDHEVTYFRREMAIANPKDYTLEELEADFYADFTEKWM